MLNVISSCAEFQSLGLKYFVVVRNVGFFSYHLESIGLEGGHSTAWGFGGFLLSHNAKEIAGLTLLNILERP